MTILAETPLWLTPIGWVVTFILGILSAVIVQRTTAKKKIVSWSVLSESELFSQSVAETASMPVKVVVGTSENTSLAAVNIRIGNTGNEVITNLEIPITFNPEATLLKHGIDNNLGEYARKLSITVIGSTLNLKLPFINPKQVVDLEILLGDYTQGSVLLDLSAPGVELRRQEAGRWDISSSTSIIKSFALSVAGIRYDPTVPPLTEVAETLRAISKKLDRIPIEKQKD